MRLIPNLLAALYIAVPAQTMPKDSIMVLKPAGGESFAVGDTIELACKVSLNIGAINIAISNTGGLLYANIATTWQRSTNILIWDPAIHMWLKSLTADSLDSSWTVSVLCAIPESLYIGDGTAYAVSNEGIFKVLSYYDYNNYANSGYFAIIPRDVEAQYHQNVRNRISHQPGQKPAFPYMQFQANGRQIDKKALMDIHQIQQSNLIIR